MFENIVWKLTTILFPPKSVKRQEGLEWDKNKTDFPSDSNYDGKFVSEMGSTACSGGPQIAFYKWQEHTKWTATH